MEEEEELVATILPASIPNSLFSLLVVAAMKEVIVQVEEKLVTPLPNYQVQCLLEQTGLFQEWALTILVCQ